MQTTDESCIIPIDYSKTTANMMRACHCYPWHNDDLIVAHLPIKGKGSVRLEAKLFHFDHPISSEEAECAIKEAGWLPAQTEHLLAYGAENPDVQQRIVALGSATNIVGWQEKRVLILGKIDGNRAVNLYGWEHNWNDKRFYCNDWHFLAVRPITQ
jgi:hypothetical protein